MDQTSPRSDARPAKRKLMTVNPTSIVFDLSVREPVADLRVSNIVGGDQMLAFKVKTTVPKRYLVKPNLDVVEAQGQPKSVKILLQAQDTKELYDKYRERAGEVVPSDADQFLVQGCVVSENWASRVESASKDPKRLTSDLQEMWKSKGKHEFDNKKLRCLFKIPSQVPEWYKTLTGTEGDASESIPFARLVRMPSHTPGEFADGQQQHASAPPAARPPSSEGDVDVTELAELRRKYNDLVNFTVQLTAERDRVVESFKEKCGELERMQEVTAKGGGSASGSSAASSLRDAMAAGESGAVQAANSTNNGSFTLWQLMLLSVVVFMIARLLG